GYASTGVNLQMEPLRKAFLQGKARIDHLLVADPDKPLASGGDPERINIAYLASGALVQWIEAEHGHARFIRFLQQLADDVAVRTALDTVFRTTPLDVNRAVRTFVLKGQS